MVYTADDKTQGAPHHLTLDERKKLTLTGVTEVESFDENTIVLKTTRGGLIIRGEGLHLQALSLDGGQVSVDGTITALAYEAPRAEGGFFSRLLR